MKKVLVLVLGFFLLSAAANTGQMAVSIQYENNGDRLYLIQDLQTGTRCYAMTNAKTDGLSAGGYALSCK